LVVVSNLIELATALCKYNQRRTQKFKKKIILALRSDADKTDTADGYRRLNHLDGNARGGHHDRSSSQQVNGTK
jgi:hypothetical protein